MALKKLTEFAALSTLAATTKFLVTDVADTSMAPTGTNKTVPGDLLATVEYVDAGLSILTDALGGDPDFSTTVATALGNRLRIDAAQSLSAPQKTQAIANLGILAEALTTIDVSAGGTISVADSILSALGKLGYLATINITSAGGTISGALIVTNAVTVDRLSVASVSVAYAASVALDFDNKGWVYIGQLTGNLTLTTSNRADNKELSVRLIGDASLTRSLSFPAWTWVGGVAPVSIASGKTAILSLRCTGTTDASIIASYAVQS